jgi:hypothetical protein
MNLLIKAQSCIDAGNGRYQLTTGCEDLKEALDAHSPNILVDYLNERYNTGISHIDRKRKEAEHGNI